MGKGICLGDTQYVIDHMEPGSARNLGTAAALMRIEQGSIILVERTIIYDIVEQMTDPAEAIEHYSTVLDLEWLPDRLPSPVRRGFLVSGDRDILVEDIPELIAKYDAVAADWESGAMPGRQAQSTAPVDPAGRQRPRWERRRRGLWRLHALPFAHKGHPASAPGHTPGVVVHRRKFHAQSAE